MTLEVCTKYNRRRERKGCYGFVSGLKFILMLWPYELQLGVLLESLCGVCACFPVYPYIPLHRHTHTYMYKREKAKRENLPGCENR